MSMHKCHQPCCWICLITGGGNWVFEKANRPSRGKSKEILVYRFAEVTAVNVDCFCKRYLMDLIECGVSIRLGVKVGGTLTPKEGSLENGNSIISRWSSGRLSITTRMGSSTSIRRGTVFSRYLRTTRSNRLISMVVSALVTPSSLTNVKIAPGGTPRRRSAIRVYRRGSSQSRTQLVSISFMILRLERTVPDTFNRPNLKAVSSRAVSNLLKGSLKIGRWCSNIQNEKGFCSLVHQDTRRESKEIQSLLSLHWFVDLDSIAKPFV